jgi:tripartite-type tricarboxylate transporter receptor subunit TctC
MNMTKRRTIVLAGLSPLFAPAVKAQGAWPNKPLRFVIGGAAGGDSDILLRMLESRLRERLGQPIVIDPRPGAGGMLGAEVAARSAPDGYTYYINQIASHGIGPSLYRRLSFDPIKDLPGIARIAGMPNVLIIKGDSPINTVRELVAFCKTNPTRANFSSAGSGTSSHLAGILFGMRMGIEVQHVPYRGTAPSMAAVMNGETLFAIGAAPASRQQVLGGLLKALGVSTAQRSSTMPEVATLQEQGVPDFNVSSWYGITAPAGVPMTIRERLGAEVVAALQEQSIVQRIRDFGAEAWPLGPSDYDSFMRREVDTWAPIVQASGVQID